MSGVTTREYDIALINMYNKSSRRKLDVNKLRYIKIEQMFSSDALE